MALAERLLHSRFGEKLVAHNTWVIVSDGCLQEDIKHEAILLRTYVVLAP